MKLKLIFSDLLLSSNIKDINYLNFYRNITDPMAKNGVLAINLNIYI